MYLGVLGSNNAMSVALPSVSDTGVGALGPGGGEEVIIELRRPALDLALVWRPLSFFVSEANLLFGLPLPRVGVVCSSLCPSGVADFSSSPSSSFALSSILPIFLKTHYMKKVLSNDKMSLFMATFAQVISEYNKAKG